MRQSRGVRTVIALGNYKTDLKYKPSITPAVTWGLFRLLKIFESVKSEKHRGEYMLYHTCAVGRASFSSGCATSSKDWKDDYSQQTCKAKDRDLYVEATCAVKLHVVVLGLQKTCLEWFFFFFYVVFLTDPLVWTPCWSNPADIWCFLCWFSVIH